MSLFAYIGNRRYPLNTDTQQKIAARELSRIGVNSVEVWKNVRQVYCCFQGMTPGAQPDDIRTHFVMLADTDVNPLENGTRVR